MKQTLAALFLCVFGIASLSAQQNIVQHTLIGVTLQQSPLGDCRQQFYNFVIDPNENGWVCNASNGTWTATTFTTGTTGTGLAVLQTAPTILTPNLTLPVIEDSTDTTKALKFSLSGGTTAFATTLTFAPTAARTITFPDATDTVVELTATQTLTNKTLTSPTLTTPALGVATATSINAVAITAPATAATLTIANNKTLTVSNSLTFAGTDSTTETFPSTSATIARTDAGQTFTGVDVFTAPTLTNPVINGPAPVACGATCVVSTAQAGIVFLLNQAGGSTATLPTSSGSGNIYKFLITVATTSAQEKILLTTTSDAIIGTAIGENTGTAKVFVGNASTYHSIQMPFTGSQPAGGFIGDSIICTDIATGTWACQIVYQGGTTPTTPFSASTS